MIDLMEEIDLIQDEENGILSDDSTAGEHGIKLVQHLRGGEFISK